jgi:hypothetical protein
MPCKRQFLALPSGDIISPHGVLLLLVDCYLIQVLAVCHMYMRGECYRSTDKAQNLYVQTAVYT